MSPLFLLPAAVFVVVLAVVITTLKRTLHVVSPHQVLVLSGRRRSRANAIVGYRAIRGGRALQIPLLERVDLFDVSPIAVELTAFEVATASDLPLQLTVRASVQPAGEEPRLQRALECFLGRRREEIAAIAKLVLAGELRAVALQVTPEEIVLDTASFEAQLSREAEHSLSRLGLALDGLRVADIPAAFGYEKRLRRG